MTDIARRNAALVEVARQANAASWRERLAALRAIPICDLGRERSDELTRLLDLEAATAEAAKIERETGVNPLAMGCAWR